jgi:hypothetical protein
MQFGSAYSRRGLISVLSALSVLASAARAQDTPKYFSKAFRDSTAEYHGRVEVYRQELYSYDWGMGMAVLPIMGESYVDKLGTGIRYSIARTAAVAVATVGTVRLIRGSPYLGLNIGMLAGGIIGFFALKSSEISDVMQTVSEKNEALAEKWQIAEPDIEPGSIRSPTKPMSDWITHGPERRDPRRAREAVDKPLPAVH